MTKTKSTKRALLMSALALLMCVSMLIGSTFAWFTDSVTSSGNKIVAGTLDIQLLMNTGDGYKDISDDTAPIFGAGSIAQNNNAETLWEPGKTQVAYLAIKNNGNLALKYTVGLDVQNVGKDLYKVMQYAITPDAQYNSVTSWAGNGNNVVVGTQSVSESVALGVGETHYFALSIHMDEAAGNEYQGGEVNFDLTILATQLTSEFDSFDDQYDKDADYDGEISNATSLAAAFANGGTYKMINDISVTESLNIPAGVTVNLDLNGKTITGTKGRDADNNRIHVIVNNGILTIKDGTVKSAGNDGGSAICNNAGATLTIEDVTLYGAPQSDPVYEAGVSKPFPSYAVNNYGNAVVNGATVKSYHGAIATGGNGVTVINDADIDVGLGQSTGITSYVIYSYENAQVTVNGGKFAFTKQEIYVNGGNTFCELGTNPIMINGGNYIGTSFSTAAGREYVIKGGTFDKDPTAYVANSHQVVDNGDGTYTVLPKVEGAELTYYADGLYSDANSSKNYYVASGAGMDTVAEKINDGTLAKNTNITLLTDIDLTDVDYAPISGNKGDSWYTGTFDGQNHTITGMTVNAYEGGLIGSSNGTVKNVIIDGATVTGSYHAAGIVGTGYGSIQNCTVKNSAIIGNYAGALRGYSASGTNTGNTVENCTINGKYAAGGLFGLVTADGKNTISDNTVKNCDIYCEVPAGNSYNGIGEVVGRSASDKVVIENNMTENVTLH